MAKLSNRARWLLRRVTVHHKRVMRHQVRWDTVAHTHQWFEVAHYERTMVCKLCKKRTMFASRMFRHLIEAHGMADNFILRRYLGIMEGSREEKFNADSLGEGE